MDIGIEEEAVLTQTSCAITVKEISEMYRAMRKTVRILSVVVDAN